MLRDTNADLLSLDMYIKHLLDANGQDLISTGYSVHHRNWLLLEHVRHLDKEAFCELVRNLWPEVGLQLITGMFGQGTQLCLISFNLIYMHIHSYY